MPERSPRVGEGQPERLGQHAPGQGVAQRDGERPADRAMQVTRQFEALAACRSRSPRHIRHHAAAHKQRPPVRFAQWRAGINRQRRTRRQGAPSSDRIRRRGAIHLETTIRNHVRRPLVGADRTVGRLGRHPVEVAINGHRRPIQIDRNGRSSRHLGAARPQYASGQQRRSVS